MRRTLTVIVPLLFVVATLAGCASDDPDPMDQIEAPAPPPILPIDDCSLDSTTADAPDADAPLDQLAMPPTQHDVQVGYATSPDGDVLIRWRWPGPGEDSGTFELRRDGQPIASVSATTSASAARDILDDTDPRWPDLSDDLIARFATPGPGGLPGASGPIDSVQDLLDLWAHPANEGMAAQLANEYYPVALVIGLGAIDDPGAGTYQYTVEAPDGSTGSVMVTAGQKTPLAAVSAFDCINLNEGSANRVDGAETWQDQQRNDIYHNRVHFWWQVPGDGQAGGDGNGPWHAGYDLYRGPVDGNNLERLESVDDIPIQPAGDDVAPPPRAKPQLNAFIEDAPGTGNDGGDSYQIATADPPDDVRALPIYAIDQPVFAGTYRYAVAPRDLMGQTAEWGEDDWFSEVKRATARDFDGPGIPRNAKAEPIRLDGLPIGDTPGKRSPDAIRLTWDDPDDDEGLSKFAVYAASNPNAQGPGGGCVGDCWTLLEETTGYTVTDDRDSPRHRWYRIQAFDEWDNGGPATDPIYALMLDLDGPSRPTLRPCTEDGGIVWEPTPPPRPPDANDAILDGPDDPLDPDDGFQVPTDPDEPPPRPQDPSRGFFDRVPGGGPPEDPPGPTDPNDPGPGSGPGNNGGGTNGGSDGGGADGGGSDDPDDGRDDDDGSNGGGNNGGGSNGGQGGASGDDVFYWDLQGPPRLREALPAQPHVDTATISFDGRIATTGGGNGGGTIGTGGNTQGNGGGNTIRGSIATPPPPTDDDNGCIEFDPGDSDTTIGRIFCRGDGSSNWVYLAEVPALAGPGNPTEVDLSYRYAPDQLITLGCTIVGYDRYGNPSIPADIVSIDFGEPGAETPYTPYPFITSVTSEEDPAGLYGWRTDIDWFLDLSTDEAHCVPLDEACLPYMAEAYTDFIDPNILGYAENGLDLETYYEVPSEGMLWAACAINKAWVQDGVDLDQSDLGTHPDRPPFVGADKKSASNLCAHPDHTVRYWMEAGAHLHTMGSEHACCKGFEFRGPDWWYTIIQGQNRVMREIEWIDSEITAGGSGNVLAWECPDLPCPISEDDPYAFAIYRAPSADGPWVQHTSILYRKEFTPVPQGGPTYEWVPDTDSARLEAAGTILGTIPTLEPPAVHPYKFIDRDRQFGNSWYQVVGFDRLSGEPAVYTEPRAVTRGFGVNSFDWDNVERTDVTAAPAPSNGGSCTSTGVPQPNQPIQFAGGATVQLNGLTPSWNGPGFTLTGEWDQHPVRVDGNHRGCDGPYTINANTPVLIQDPDGLDYLIHGATFHDFIGGPGGVQLNVQMLLPDGVDARTSPNQGVTTLAMLLKGVWIEDTLDWQYRNKASGGPGTIIGTGGGSGGGPNEGGPCKFQDPWDDSPFEFTLDNAPVEIYGDTIRVVNGQIIITNACMDGKDYDGTGQGAATLGAAAWHEEILWDGVNPTPQWDGLNNHGWLHATYGGGATIDPDGLDGTFTRDDEETQWFNAAPYGYQMRAASIEFSFEDSRIDSGETGAVLAVIDAWENTNRSLMLDPDDPKLQTRFGAVADKLLIEEDGAMYGWSEVTGFPIRWAGPSGFTMEQKDWWRFYGAPATTDHAPVTKRTVSDDFLSDWIVAQWEPRPGDVVDIQKPTPHGDPDDFNIFQPPANVPFDDTFEAPGNLEPGLNLREHDSRLNWQCVGNKKFDMMMDVYLARSGVSGNFKAHIDGPEAFSPYGYSASVEKFQLHVLGNRIYDRFVLGELDLPYPADMHFRMVDWSFDEGGCLAGGRVPDADKLQHLGYWDMDVWADTVAFRPESDAPADDPPPDPVEKTLWIQGKMKIPNLKGSQTGGRVAMDSAWAPDGNFIEMTPLIQGSTFTFMEYPMLVERIRLSNYVGREKPQWNQDASLDPFPSGNAGFDGGGFVEIEGPLQLPFLGPMYERLGPNEEESDPLSYFVVPWQGFDDEPPTSDVSFVGLGGFGEASRKWVDDPDVGVDLTFDDLLLVRDAADDVFRFFGHDIVCFKPGQACGDGVVQLENLAIMDPFEGPVFNSGIGALGAAFTGIADARGLLDDIDLSGLSGQALSDEIRSRMEGVLGADVNEWGERLLGGAGWADIGPESLDRFYEQWAGAPLGQGLENLWPDAGVGGFADLGSYWDDITGNAGGFADSFTSWGGAANRLPDLVDNLGLQADIPYLDTLSGAIGDFQGADRGISLQDMAGAADVLPTDLGLGIGDFELGSFDVGLDGSVNPFGGSGKRSMFDGVDLDFQILDQGALYITGSTSVGMKVMDMAVDVKFEATIVPATPSFEGSVGLGQFKLQVLTIQSAGAVFGVSPEFQYFGMDLSATVKVTPALPPASVEGAFLAGNIPKQSQTLSSRFPDIMTFIGQVPTDDATLKGFYLRVYADIPIWSAGCLLSVNVGGGLGIWTFAASDALALGMELRGTVTGKVACIITGKGSLTVRVDAIRDADHDWRRSLYGEAWLAAGLGFCEPETWKKWENKWWGDTWCAQGGAYFEFTYTKDFDGTESFDKDWEVSIEPFS